MANSSLRLAFLVSIFLHAVAILTVYSAFLKQENTKQSTMQFCFSYTKEDITDTQKKPMENIDQHKIAQSVKNINQHQSAQKEQDKGVIEHSQNTKQQKTEQTYMEPSANATYEQKISNATEQPKESKIDIDIEISKIREIVSKYKKYPNIARKMGYEGVCIVSFKLEPSGTVKEIRVVKSSGYQSLDKSTVETIEEAATEMPKPQKTIEILLPIEYKLN